MRRRKKRAEAAEARARGATTRDAMLVSDGGLEEGMMVSDVSGTGSRGDEGSVAGGSAGEGTAGDDHAAAARMTMLPETNLIHLEVGSSDGVSHKGWLP